MAEPPPPLELLTELDMRRALYRKLHQAQLDAPAITKGRTTQEQGAWAYASHDDVVNALVPVLLANDLVLTRSFVGSEDFETKTKDGKLQWMHSARYQYTLTDAETGFQITFLAEGRSMNTDDRGAIHAVSNAEKPFLLGLLMAAQEEKEKKSTPASSSRAPRGAGQGRQPPPQPRSSEPVGVKHNSGPARISEAMGKTFKRIGDDRWVQGPEGLELPSCRKHDGGAPMMELPPKGQRFLCVIEDCGEYVDMRDEPAHAPVGANPPAPAAGPPPPKAMPETVEILQAEVERLVKQRHLYQWQWDAIKGGNPELDCEIAAWGPKRWTWVLDQLRKNYPLFIAGSIARCAADTPAADYRARHLRELADSQKGLPMAKRAEVEEAIKSGWHDAVEELIDQLETKREQGELQIGSAVKVGGST